MPEHRTTLVALGDTIEHELPYSEVCMYMRVAGKRMRVTVLDGGMAQLWGDFDSPYSFPITWGEAGIFRDHTGAPYIIDGGTPS